MESGIFPSTEQSPEINKALMAFRASQVLKKCTSLEAKSVMRHLTEEVISNDSNSMEEWLMWEMGALK